MRGIKIHTIYDDLITIIHNEARGYPTVTLWLRQEQLAHFSEPNHNLTDNHQINETDQVILSALIAEPFILMRDIARLICFHRSIVHLYLARSLRFIIRHVHWIPHLIANNQKHN
jgi:hypothetical protein